MNAKQVGGSLVKACSLCKMIQVKQWQWLLLEANVSVILSQVASSQRTEWVSKRRHVFNFFISSLQLAPLWLNRHLQDVFSFDRWWVGLDHVWSSGNTGVFCGVAQVSQCGSLSTRVRHFCFCVWPLSPSCFLQVSMKSIGPCSFFNTVRATHSSLTGVAQFVWPRCRQACAKCALTSDSRTLCQLAEISKTWVMGFKSVNTDLNRTFYQG